MTAPQLQRADAVSYFVYLRSLFFDHDLDFANEWQRWGYPPQPVTSTGLRGNAQSIGPAILWSPFFGLTHAYLFVKRAVGSSAYALDGYSVPYWRSAALGTLAIAWAGTCLLASAARARFGSGNTLVAFAATIGGSIVAYYVFVLPTMAHGLAFGVAAAAVWAWFRASSEPSRWSWLLLGAATGLLVLVRWQAAVFVLLPALLAARQLRQGTVTPARLALAGLAGLLAFAPQCLAWKVLFGRFILMPQGESFLNWWSPHFLDVLVSADHGLFTWTPIAFLGLAGMMLFRSSEPLFAYGAIAVCLGNAWLCGGVRDYAASDAFGARRFDFVMPLVAMGVAVLVDRAGGFIASRPAWILIACAGALTAWNVGFIHVFEKGRFERAVPFVPLVVEQAESFRMLVSGSLGKIAGHRGRSLAYKMFVGEYFYDNANPSGSIQVGAVNSSFLLEGWSKVRLQEGGPQFRWAHAPRACVRIPLGAPFDLRVSVTARSAPGTPSEAVTFTVNGQSAAGETLEPQWKTVTFTIPKNYLFGGENRLCMTFPPSRDGAEGRAAAAVTLIQLP